MDTDFYTLGVLALVLLGGWLADHLGGWGRSDLSQEMERQLQKSADTIRGAPLH